MKKFSIFCVFLGILTGLSFAERKPNRKAWLEFSYEKSYRDISLASKSTILSAQIGNWWVKRDLTGIKGDEAINRSFLKASFAATSRLKLDALIGIGRIDQEFQEVSSRRSSGYLDFPEWSQKEKEYSITGRSEMEFLYGFGMQLIFLRKNNFSAIFDAQYIHQEEGPNTKILFNDSSIGYGEFSYVYWQQKAETQKARTQEFNIGILFSVKTKEITLCVGPKLLLSQTLYTGEAMEKSGYIFYPNPRFNYDNTYTNEFEFRTENKNVFSFTTRINFSITEISEIFIETRIGAITGVVAGLNCKI